MSGIFESLFAPERSLMPYKDNNEYLNDEFGRIELLLTYYLRAKKDNNFKQVRKSVLKDFNNVDDFIKSRLKSSKNAFFTGEYVKTVYNLTSIEWFCVLAAVLAQTDKKYLRMLLEIENENTLSYNALLKLYFFVSDVSEINDYYNVYNSLSAKMNFLCFEDGVVKIDDRLFENIMSNAKNDIHIFGINFRLPQKSKALDIREDIAEKMCGFINKSQINEPVYYHLHGEEGIGKKTLVRRACDILQKGLVYIDLKQRPSDSAEFFKFIMYAYREAFFNKSFICIGNFEDILKDTQINENHINFILRSAANYSKIVFVLTDDSAGIRRYLDSFFCIDVPVDDLTNEERFKIWSTELLKLKTSKSINTHEMANKFIFTPKQIKDTAMQANLKSLWGNGSQINENMICDAAHDQVTDKLSGKATIIKKKHTWDDLVLPADQKELIKRACDQIKYKHIVYDKWGMNSKVLYGRGLSMLFTGPPGTGKTMAAQVVANELGLEIYKVDLSKVVSKYIGESEKNLGEIFDSARKSNVILLFDEFDALSGKRTEVKDSHDKNANLETSYLLQKMEEYDGITVMTTNFLENIDKALFRRISYVVNFTFPDASLRKEIWIKMYPKETPLSKDIDFDFLAHNFEIAGGNIKNAVISSTFMAASEAKKVSMHHILKALEYEIKKQGKMVSKDDFGEYGYLL